MTDTGLSLPKRDLNWPKCYDLLMVRYSPFTFYTLTVSMGNVPYFIFAEATSIPNSSFRVPQRACMIGVPEQPMKKK